VIFGGGEMTLAASVLKDFMEGKTGLYHDQLNRERNEGRFNNWKY
jgi:hypothetical protein